jgi:transcriptional regulator with XRE-family HTH domain/quercetin dioxygenase-like cupin family protein
VASSSLPPIGARLRAARHRRGVSVRGLAREIGVSASLISQIETDKSSPSVSTLYAISTALDLSLEELFSDEKADDPAAPELDDDWEGPVPIAVAQGSALGRVAMAALGQRRLGPLVSPDQRELLTLDSGVTWEMLGQIPGVHVDFLLITYPPGGSSSGSGLLMRHTGTEFGFVISGELTLTLGFETHRLTAGDSISFSSATPHAYRNESTEPAVGVWFVLEQ